MDTGSPEETRQDMTLEPRFLSQRNRKGSRHDTQVRQFLSNHIRKPLARITSIAERRAIVRDAVSMQGRKLIVATENATAL
ncbi:hypothetical protein [Bradyrhizobium lablabi]|uniref:hypothetical protein n=1 Tax=Bradyrhizobium lablabi TaxID=722472 RepID=UPI001BAB0473|nr:hypothetical protein [Bradyrhizobium lablabi]MBR0696812.1 hypothetical protein [Bradyrhizobium lablabi]